jgi:hypothetical protein
VQAGLATAIATQGLSKLLPLPSIVLKKHVLVLATLLQPVQLLPDDARAGTTTSWYLTTRTPDAVALSGAKGWWQTTMVCC